VNKMLENQEVAKLVWYNVSNPLSQVDIVNTQTLIKTRVFPYLYNGVIVEPQVQTQIRVYYGNAKIKNVVIEETPVIFEILTHDDLVLIDGTGTKLLRLYEIASRITKQFDKIPIATVGVLHFTDCIPVGGLPIDYQMIRLIANMTTLGK
jgi:hypothetical protein